MDEEVAPEESNCSLGSGPFVFSGRPPFLRGVVNLVNNSAERIKVRSVVIEGAGIEPLKSKRLAQTKAESADRQVDLLPVKLAGRVNPQDTTKLFAQLAVDKFTPPGEYKASVRLGDQQAPAVLFILQHDNLHLMPNEIRIASAPGQRITKSVYITNEGNVPFSTRKAAFAPLQALDLLHESFAVALNEAGHHGHARFLDNLVAKLAENEAPPAKIRMDLNDEVIAPGETKCVEITIQLPAELKRRTYTSRVKFGNAKLSVVVDVNKADKKTGRT